MDQERRRETEFGSDAVIVDPWEHGLRCVGKERDAPSTMPDNGIRQFRVRYGDAARDVVDSLSPSQCDAYQHFGYVVHAHEVSRRLRRTTKCDRSATSCLFDDARQKCLALPVAVNVRRPADPSSYAE